MNYRTTQVKKAPFLIARFNQGANRLNGYTGMFLNIQKAITITSRLLTNRGE